MGTVNFEPVFEPVRERQVTIKTTDKDFEKLQEMCCGYGITVGELLECFVGDLIDGVYSNGSDERQAAQKWFDRYAANLDPDLDL